MTTATQFDRQDTQVIEDRDPKSGSQLLLEAIAAQGVDTIFGYPGGAIMPVYDVLPTMPQLRHILFRHEHGCGMAAIGYARATGKLDTFAPEAKVIHMDIDIAEINKLRQTDVYLDGSLKKNLAALNPVSYTHLTLPTKRIV